MFCTKCGQKNPDHYKFCCKCGYPLKRIENPKPEVFPKSTLLDDEKRIKAQENTYIPSPTPPIANKERIPHNQNVKNVNLSSRDKISEENIEAKIIDDHKDNGEKKKAVLENIETETVSEPRNQYDENGNLILPVYAENEKKGKNGIILGIIAAILITGAGIVSYNYYIDTVPLISLYLPSKPEIQIKNLILAFYNDLENSNIDPQIFYPDFQSNIPFKKPINFKDIKIERKNNSEDYEANLSPNISLILSKNKEGNFRIISSKGFYDIPQSIREIAFKTGLWNSSLNDFEFVQRLSDQNFFDFVDEMLKERLSDIITYDNILIPISNYGEGYFVIQNNSEVSIPADWYAIKLKRIYSSIDYETGIITPFEYTEEIKGVNLSSKGMGKIRIEYRVLGTGEDVKIDNVEWKISQNEMLEKFTHLTGKEYEEYLADKEKSSLPLTEQIIFKGIKEIPSLRFNNDNAVLSKSFNNLLSLYKLFEEAQLEYGGAIGESNLDLTNSYKILSGNNNEVRVQVKYIDHFDNDKIKNFEILFIKEKFYENHNTKYRWVIDEIFHSPNLDWDRKEMAQLINREYQAIKNHGGPKNYWESIKDGGILQFSDQSEYILKATKFVNEFERLYPNGIVK